MKGKERERGFEGRARQIGETVKTDATHTHTHKEKEGLEGEVWCDGEKGQEK